jgi:hypothetical protein
MASRGLAFGWNWSCLTERRECGLKNYYSVFFSPLRLLGSHGRLLIERGDNQSRCKECGSGSSFGREFRKGNPLSCYGNGGGDTAPLAPTWGDLEGSSHLETLCYLLFTA